MDTTQQVRIIYKVILNILSLVIKKRTKYPVVAKDYISAANKKLSRFTKDFLFTDYDPNRKAMDNVHLVPLVARDVSAIDTSCELFGVSLPAPFILAPTGANVFVHPQGEIAAAKGSEGYLYVVSTMASYSMESITASSKGPFWFQLYIQRDLEFTKKLIDKALKLGCSAICVSVDSPVPTRRGNWSKYSLPKWIVAPNLKDDARQTITGIYSPRLNPSVDWQMLEELIDEYNVPFIIKGILNSEDAKQAQRIGASGIIVSNHGGRQLEGIIPSIDALPGVVNSVDIPVLYDGGIISGVDAIKAISLGATAVLIGKIYLCALGLHGEEGIRHLLKLLREELEIGMGLCGTKNLEELRSSGITGLNQKN